MGQALLKFVTVVSPLYLTGSLLALSHAVPCPVFRANPQPEGEGDMGAPVDRLPAPVHLSGVYPSAAHVS